MLFQEVGFDIVSIWNVSSLLQVIVLLLAAVLIVYGLWRLLTSDSRRRSSPP
jgi:hypothetical protein